MNPDNVRIVLVEPRLPGNIGSAARGMHVMGFRDLVLVGPEDPRGPDAWLMAYGAETIVENARLAKTLEEVIADCPVVAGTTRRVGRRRRTTHIVRDFAVQVHDLSERNRVAILFGREEGGLTNEELQRCTHVVTIPEHTDYPSLNLAQAVTVVCYELYLASCAERIRRPLVLAEPDTVEGMFNHLERALHALGFEEREHKNVPRKILEVLRKVFGRSGLEPHEANTVRGICKQVEKRLGSPH